MTHHDAIATAIERTRNTITAFPREERETMTEDTDHKRALAEALLDVLEEVAPGKGDKLARHLYRRHRIAAEKNAVDGLEQLDQEQLETSIEWVETVGLTVARHRLEVEYGLWVNAKGLLYGAVTQVLRARGLEGRGAIEGLITTLKSEWAVESLHELDSNALDRRTAEVLADGWAIPVEEPEELEDAAPLPSARARVFEDITAALDDLGLTEAEQDAWSQTVGSDYGVDMHGCLRVEQARAVLAFVRSMTREEVLRWGRERVRDAS